MHISFISGSADDNSRISPQPTTKQSKYLPSHSSYQHHNHHNQYPVSSANASATTAEAPSTSDSESVIDRIKRRSFYCRFNEKKPKRTSSIVGPAGRDYYRDISSKSRSNNHVLNSNGDLPQHLAGHLGKSPTPINLNESGATTPSNYSATDDNEHQHYHYYQTPTTKRRSATNQYDGNDRKNKSNDYLNLRSTLTSPPAANTNKYYSHSIASPSSPSSSEYLTLNGNHRPYSTRSSIYDGFTPSASSSSASSTSPFVYGTYNPKRRISTSSYISPSLGTGSSSLTTPDHHHLGNTSYATLGHRTPKSYDHRSISLLDSSSMPSTCGLSSAASKRINSSATGSEHQYPHLRAINDYGNYSSR